MGKGYAEGPAAEEAERRLEEAAAGPSPAPPVERSAVFGCTSADPTPHLLGWVEDIDADALFSSGDAWGIVVRRVSVEAGSDDLR